MALRIAGSQPLIAAAVDLMFTDGRMDGLELALNLRDTAHGLPVWLIAPGAGGTPRAVRIAPAGPGRSRRPVGIPDMMRTLCKEHRGGAR